MKLLLGGLKLKRQNPKHSACRLQTGIPEGFRQGDKLGY
jgi:hypothetical protein